MLIILPQSCYNLLKHIYRLEIVDNKWVIDVGLQSLKQRLLADWKVFKKNLIVMVDGSFPA